MWRVTLIAAAVGLTFGSGPNLLFPSGRVVTPLLHHTAFASVANDFTTYEREFLFFVNDPGASLCDGYVPQTNIGRDAWDCTDQENPSNELRFLPAAAYANRITYGAFHFLHPNTGAESVTVLGKRDDLRAAALAESAALRDRLLDRETFGTQIYTQSLFYSGARPLPAGYSEPATDVVVPDGWDWAWVTALAYDAETCAAQEKVWTDAGWTIDRTLADIAYAYSLIPAGQCLNGWVREKSGSPNTLEQYTVIFDLCSDTFQPFTATRVETTRTEVDTKNVSLSLKGYIEAGAVIEVTPDTIGSLAPGPWLPFPWEPGVQFGNEIDSARWCLAEIFRQAAASVSPNLISTSNSGDPQAGSTSPDYASADDFGLPARGVPINSVKQISQPIATWLSQGKVIALP